jgi:hypothetical protein
MAGIMVFTSVSAALRAGFQVYDRTSYGYLVRTRTSRGWALAVVHVGNNFVEHVAWTGAGIAWVPGFHPVEVIAEAPARVSDHSLA